MPVHFHLQATTKDIVSVLCSASFSSFLSSFHDTLVTSTVLFSLLSEVRNSLPHWKPNVLHIDFTLLVFAAGKLWEAPTFIADRMPNIDFFCSFFSINFELSNNLFNFTVQN